MRRSGLHPKLGASPANLAVSHLHVEIAAGCRWKGSPDLAVALWSGESANLPLILTRHYAIIATDRTCR